AGGVDDQAGVVGVQRGAVGVALHEADGGVVGRGRAGLDAQADVAGALDVDGVDGGVDADADRGGERPAPDLEVTRRQDVGVGDGADAAVAAEGDAAAVGDDPDPVALDLRVEAEVGGAAEGRAAALDDAVVDGDRGGVDRLGRALGRRQAG